MKCPVCKNGTTAKGIISVTLERGATVVVIRKVPALVCNNCGYSYTEEKISKAIMKTADDAYKAGALIEIKNLMVA